MGEPVVTFMGKEIGFVKESEDLGDMIRALEKEDTSILVPQSIETEVTLTPESLAVFKKWWADATRKQRDFINSIWSRQCRELKRKLKRVFRK